MFNKNLRLALAGLLLVGLVLTSLNTAQAAAGTYFAETGKTLDSKFQPYWQQHGGLAIFGYPITSSFEELNPSDGKVYTVQYFERNRFEYHPENAGTPYEVELGLLGVQTTQGRVFDKVAPFASSSDNLYFPEVGHSLKGGFLNYWQQHGGLALFGYPISEPLMEGDYVVQYFERNRFEYHPENAGTPYEVLLGLLGNQVLKRNLFPDLHRGNTGKCEAQHDVYATDNAHQNGYNLQVGSADGAELWSLYLPFGGREFVIVVPSGMTGYNLNGFFGEKWTLFDRGCNWKNLDQEAAGLAINKGANSTHMVYSLNEFVTGRLGRLATSTTTLVSLSGGNVETPVRKTTEPGKEIKVNDNGLWVAVVITHKNGNKVKLLMDKSQNYPFNGVWIDSWGWSENGISAAFKGYNDIPLPTTDLRELQAQGVIPR